MVSKIPLCALMYAHKYHIINHMSKFGHQRAPALKNFNLLKKPKASSIKSLSSDLVFKAVESINVSQDASSVPVW